MKAARVGTLESKIRKNRWCYGYGIIPYDFLKFSDWERARGSLWVLIHVLLSVALSLQLSLAPVLVRLARNSHVVPPIVPMTI